MTVYLFVALLVALVCDLLGMLNRGATAIKRAAQSRFNRVMGTTLPRRTVSMPTPVPALEIIRVWHVGPVYVDGITMPECWVHEVRQGGTILARSRHLDELQEKYPTAIRTGLVLCGDNAYYESRD